MAELSVLRDVVDRLRPKLTQRWPIAAQKAALAYIHRTSVEQAVDDLRVSRTRLKFWVNFGIMQSDGFLSLDREVLNREQRTLTLWIREYLTDRHPDHHLCIGPQGYGPILRKAVVVLCLSCKSDVSKASRLSSISIGSIRLWLGTYDTINVAEFYDLHIREHEERFKEDPEESVEDTTNEENMTDTTDTTDTKTSVKEETDRIIQLVVHEANDYDDYINGLFGALRRVEEASEILIHLVDEGQENNGDYDVTSLLEGIWTAEKDLKMLLRRKVLVANM